MAERQRVGVLVSGRGSNLQALIDAAGAADFPARIVGVISNKRGAYALERARAADIPSATISHRQFEGRAAFEEALIAQLRDWQVDWVVLAGFMRVLTPTFIRAFAPRILNIHPSLLPAFPGVGVQQAALDYGVRVSGCTVHLVDEGTDTGPIIAQAAVPVRDDDNAESLAARILVEEHRIFPAAIRQIISKPWRLVGRRIVFEDAP
ncbi:MAG: phosphoribosylglycinamide formyltransferase [Myxococcales bacterium]|nr:phosphoribosylglycinamide formyltransferase [Myxococcales bacterium]